MAIMGPWTNAEVLVNAVDISAWTTSVTIETSRDEVDVTAMGAVNKVTMPGLGDATIEIEVLQGFGAGEIDATMQPLSVTSTPFNVWVKPVKGTAISATNPQYQMSSLLFSYNPMDGGVGDAMKTTLTFKNAAQAGLVRDITP